MKYVHDYSYSYIIQTPNSGIDINKDSAISFWRPHSSNIKEQVELESTSSSSFNLFNTQLSIDECPQSYPYIANYIGDYTFNILIQNCTLII